MSVIKKSRHFAQSPLKLIRFVLSDDLVFARNIMIVFRCAYCVYTYAVYVGTQTVGVSPPGVEHRWGICAGAGGGTPRRWHSQAVVGTPWQPATLNRRGC